MHYKVNELYKMAQVGIVTFRSCWSTSKQTNKKKKRWIWSEISWFYFLLVCLYPCFKSQGLTKVNYWGRGRSEKYHFRVRMWLMLCGSSVCFGEYGCMKEWVIICASLLPLEWKASGLVLPKGTGKRWGGSFMKYRLQRQGKAMKGWYCSWFELILTNQLTSRLPE